MNKEDKNRLATVLWTCGNPGRDGNGPCWRMPVYIHSKSRKWDILNYIERDFPDDCRSMLGIDINSWLNNYGETSIPDKDFTALVNAGVISVGSANSFTPSAFFALWCALLKRVRPDVSVEVRRLPEIRPHCGKGLVLK